MEGWLCFLPWSCCAGNKVSRRKRERELGNSFNWYVVSRMTRLYRARNSFRFVPRFLIEGRGGWTFVSNRGYRSPQYGKHWRANRGWFTIREIVENSVEAAPCRLGIYWISKVDRGFTLKASSGILLFETSPTRQFPDPSLHYRNSWLTEIYFEIFSLKLLSDNCCRSNFTWNMYTVLQ